MDLEALKNSMPDLHRATASKSLEEIEHEKVFEKYATDYEIFCNDFSTYRFRPHAVFNLMGGLPKPLTECQENALIGLEEKFEIQGNKMAKTNLEKLVDLRKKRDAKLILNPAAIKYLKCIFKEFKFKRTNELRNKYTDKGLAVEGESIELVNTLYGYNLQKNTTRFENKWLSGEPDIINGDEVYDIKSSWDFTTFPMLDEEVENKTYYYQLQAYMDLLGFKKAKLIYVLSNTPEMLIEDEKRRTSWKLGMIDLPQDLEYEIERNLTYGDLTEENPYLRIKIFDVERDDKVIEQMHQMIDLAREYLVEIDNKLKQNFSLT